MLIRSCLFFVLFILIGCNQHPTPQGHMKEITVNSADGFHDVVLPIESHSFDESKNLTLLARGTHKGSTVGIRIRIRPHTRPGLVSDSLDRQAVVFAGISFESLGKESDGLLSVLAGLYGIDQTKPFAQHPVSFTSFPLVEKIDLVNSPTRFKIFFDDQDKLGLYCEFFCIVNLPAGEVELAEKDVDYRENFVKSLAY